MAQRRATKIERGRAYEAARRHIAKANAERWKFLDFTGENFKALSSIPPEIVTLQRLGRLDLSNTQVKDLSPISDLARLTILFCAGTGVADLSPLTNKSGLLELNINDTEVSNLAPLAGLSKLKALYINDTHITDLMPLAGLSQLGQDITDGLWFANTPVADQDDAHRALAEIVNDQDRAKQVLQFLNGVHPEFGGPPGPWVPPKSPQPQKPPEDDTEQLAKALQGPFLTLSHSDFGVQNQKVTVLPFDHDAVADPTESRSHKDMLETLAWAAGELLRLAVLNQLGRRDADRLSQYIGYAQAARLNARLLQMIARSLLASIEAAKTEGRLQPEDQQIAEDFLLAHRTLIGEFYPEVLSVEARVAAQEIDASVTAEDILSPVQQLGGVLREEADLVTPELRQAFEALERISADYQEAEDRAPLMAPEDVEAARGGFLGFAKRTGATIGRLYLSVKRYAIEIASAGGGAAGMEAQWQVFSGLATRLGEIWQKVAPFFPSLF